MTILVGIHAGKHVILLSDKRLTTEGIDGEQSTFSDCENKSSKHKHGIFSTAGYKRGNIIISWEFDDNSIRSVEGLSASYQRALESPHIEIQGDSNEVTGTKLIVGSQDKNGALRMFSLRGGKTKFEDPCIKEYSPGEISVAIPYDVNIDTLNEFLDKMIESVKLNVNKYKEVLNEKTSRGVIEIAQEICCIITEYTCNLNSVSKEIDILTFSSSGMKLEGVYEPNSKLVLNRIKQPYEMTPSCG